MYTTNKTSNRLLLSTIITFILVLMVFLNIQNVYAESTMISIYNIEQNNEKSIQLYEFNKYIPSLAQQIEAKQQKEIEEQKRLAKIEMMTVSSSRNIQYNEINVYTDLSVMATINADQMNEVIDYWTRLRNGNTTFTGQGQVFIDAAKESGLDPIYILAHAAVESGWGTSYYAKQYHNYFGIGAFDYDPDNAINYGNNSMANGIIEGAKWIADNYYDNGQTSLYTMRYNNGAHEYCTSNSWMYNIQSIMSTSYNIIQS